jgi:hypothetical protein
MDLIFGCLQLKNKKQALSIAGGLFFYRFAEMGK